MTIQTLFLLVIPIYLALIAYGQVGARKRGLGTRARAIAGTLRVVVPPAALMLALLSTGDAYLIAGWGMVTLGMLVVGAIVAVAVEFIAPRVGA
jgi:hypothetical protein